MSERDVPSLLQDILEAIGNIKDFTRGITFDMYLGDLKTKHAVTKDAVERNSEIVGMAASCANPNELRQKMKTFELSFSQKKKNMAVVERNLIKVSVMYPYAEGKTFHMEYYETKHMPMVAAFLGSNLIKYTIEKGLASGIPSQNGSQLGGGGFHF